MKRIIGIVLGLVCLVTYINADIIGDIMGQLKAVVGAVVLGVAYLIDAVFVYRATAQESFESGYNEGMEYGFHRGWVGGSQRVVNMEDFDCHG